MTTQTICKNLVFLENSENTTDAASNELMMRIKERLTSADERKLKIVFYFVESLVK